MSFYISRNSNSRKEKTKTMPKRRMLTLILNFMFPHKNTLTIMFHQEIKMFYYFLLQKTVIIVHSGLRNSDEFIKRQIILRAETYDEIPT